MRFFSPLEIRLERVICSMSIILALLASFVLLNVALKEYEGT